MAVVAYVAQGEATGPKFCQAFAQGAGGYTVVSKKLLPGQVAMFGSPRLWDILTQARREGRIWYYGDHAYFQRFKFYRITRCALAHKGKPGRGAPADYDRLERLGVRIRPWRAGNHIVVCPPDDLYAGLIGFSAADWLSDALNTLRANTDRRIQVRDRHWKGTSLQQDLKDAHALVTYHSNAAVEAICEGVPAFVTTDCPARAMSEVRLDRIERPRMPDGRKRWAAILAANQWTMDEIRSGDAWRVLGANG